MAAIKGYAVSISPTSNGVSLDWKVDTTGRPLSAAQLPLAPGSTAPALASGEPGGLGIRDPAQIAAFVESAVQAVNPNGYAQFQAALGALRRGFGIDVTGALGKLTGDLITAGEGQTSLIRAGVSDPAAVRQTLSNLQKHIHSFSPNINMRPRRRRLLPDHQSITDCRGGIGGQSIGRRDASIAKLRAFATKPTRPPVAMARSPSRNRCPRCSSSPADSCAPRRRSSSSVS